MLVSCILLPVWVVAGEAWRACPDDQADKEVSEVREFVLSHEGDPARGRFLFENTKPIACRKCHTVRGEGGRVGPDLSDIGNKFDRPHLIESLLEPSREIVEGYRGTVLSMRDGRVAYGIVVSETRERITLIDADLEQREIAKSKIDERSISKTSMMPDGRSLGLSPAQLADLVAFLETLRPARPPTPGERMSEAFSLPPGFRVRAVATGLTGPTALDVAPDGRAFVCEQTGTLRVVAHDVLLPEPFVRLKVDSSWERGLIGVTVDPRFPAQPYVYVCYVAPEPFPHHRVSRLTARGDVAEAGSERALLRGDYQTKLGGTVPAGHQGGALHFGSDGMLYVAVGEQTAGLPAQNLHSLLGKILRMRPDGSIPDNNPFVDRTEGKYQAIWALGLRNPFTFAVQSESGRIFANDVGQNAWEEINEIERGGNYGWPESEGKTADARFRSPVYSYPAASIAGAAFAPRKLDWPKEYRGQYFFMDFVRGWIKLLDPERPEREPQTFATGLRRPVDLRFAADGSLYVLVRDAWVIDDLFTPGTGSLLKIEGPAASR